jgi:hypothetical protein
MPLQKQWEPLRKSSEMSGILQMLTKDFTSSSLFITFLIRAMGSACNLNSGSVCSTGVKMSHSEYLPLIDCSRMLGESAAVLFAELLGFAYCQARSPYCPFV